MAEGSFAPVPDRVRAPLDQPINAQSGLLTGDCLAATGQPLQRTARRSVFQL